MHARILVVARRVVAVFERRDVTHDELWALLAGLLYVLVPSDTKCPGSVIDGNQTLPLLNGNGHGVVKAKPFCLELCGQGQCGTKRLSADRLRN